jgi:two-component system, chemotaxis family, protein-glutamate methylesterase/glutaminase
MKVLVLAEQNECGKLLDDLSGIGGDTVFIHGPNVLKIAANPAEADVILGGAPGHVSNDSILAWRCHHHTYLVPCWVQVRREEFSGGCLWPALAIDRFDPECTAGAFSQWLSQVAEWQQNRMHFGKGGDLRERSALELSTALCLRKATGVLSVFDDDGAEGEFFIKDGNLISASFKHLREAQAFFEFLCTRGGGYAWNGRNLPKGGEQRPLSLLIAQGLKNIGEANFLYHFVSNPNQQIRTTDSQSALDDSAVENFNEIKKIYSLIEKGASLGQLMVASPLSAPSTMAVLSKWFSLEDITLVAEGASEPEEQAVASEQVSGAETMDVVSEPISESDHIELVLGHLTAEEEFPPVPEQIPGSECSVLIVDDSPLICNVLRNIFEGDSRMRVAGIAHDGIEALQMIGEHKPDVVTLDLQMPRMDGLTALKHILIKDPRPVVVLSAFTEATSRLTYESFKYGAVEVLQKPANAANAGRAGNGEICDRIVQASRVQLAAVRYIRRREKSDGDLPASPHRDPTNGAEKVMMVICGAGGIPALLKLIFTLPRSNRLPPTIIGVDMPWQVTEAMITNIQKDTPVAMEKLGAAGLLRPGCCYIASHEDRYRFLDEGNRVQADRSGVDHAPKRFFDELLSSAADSLYSRLVAIALSGPGQDGVEGMRRVKQSGGEVFALTPGACLRPELPERLIKLGYAQEIIDIGGLSELFHTRTTRVHPEHIGQALEELSDSDLS